MSEYELILMLDPEVEEEARNGLADSAQQRIESKGELRHSDAWGIRKMTYEIEKRTEADYRLYRFTGDNELLGELDHNLKIADGILRFRIFKVDPRSPNLSQPEIWSPPRREDGPRGGRRRDEDDDGGSSYEDRGDRDRSAPSAPEAGEPETATVAAEGDAGDSERPADAS